MTLQYCEYIFVMIISLLLLTTIVGCITNLDPRLFHNYSRYTLSIQSDGPIENVTFIFPLPVKNGTPRVASEILDENDFVQNNVSIGFTRNPPNLNLTDSEILDNYEFCFVIIRTEKSIPSQSGPYVNIFQIQKNVNTPMGEYQGYINTVYPIGNESLIGPKFNFTWQEPQINKRETSHFRYTEEIIPQKTKIFAQYEASPSRRVNIFFQLRESNGWKEGYDAWIGNSYSETFSKYFTGPQSGWFFINGEMMVAEGTYPNYDHPEWQKVLNKTSESEQRSSMEIYDYIFSFF